jgi:FPC/CPF motif-containing protein YcgG
MTLRPVPPDVLDRIPAPSKEALGTGNPFDSALAHANRSYAAFREGRLVDAYDPAVPPSRCVQAVHDRFRAAVLDPAFSCLGAGAAVNRGAYRLGVYRDLGSEAATAGLAHDLYTYVQELPRLAGGFTTFIASFSGPGELDEASFERLLWQQLQHLHDEDYRYHPWDPAVGADPEGADFSFSIAGQAFFVVGMHPGSSRIARRFPWPTLAFNAHQQFSQLRARGQFAKMQSLIREREQALQGSLNPNPRVVVHGLRPSVHRERAAHQPGAPCLGLGRAGYPAYS